MEKFNISALKSETAIVISIILSIAIVISTFSLSNAIKSINKETTIGVTGSAQMDIESDYAVWTGSFKATTTTQKDGYLKLVSDKKTVEDYLKSKSISDSELSFGPIISSEIYKKDYNNNPTNELQGYMSTQVVTIKSSNVSLIDEISRTSTELLNKGVSFTSDPAQFYVKDLSKIKVDMVGKATKDCKDRANQIVKNAGGRLGSIVSAKTGVFQVTPQNSTEISDYGVNDTTSIKKQITAVVKCTFSVN